MYASYEEHWIHMLLRSSSNCNQMFAVPRLSLTKFKESLSYSGPTIRSSIPNAITNTATLSSFSKKKRLS